MTLPHEIISSNLFERILLDPIKRGARELFVISGYASASMVTKHFDIAAKDLKVDLSIDLHIGMAGRDGLSRNTLLGLQSIPRQIGDKSFNCTMTTRGRSNHAKLYVWCDAAGPREAYLGSSNYTQFGFGVSQAEMTHSEICTQVDPALAFHYAVNAAKGAISYKSPDIADHVELFDDPGRQSFGHDESDLLEVLSDFVDLPLVVLKGADKNQVHKKSGLNWGQRDGRNPDQAYIPVPAEITKLGFLPERGAHFQVVTDDGEAFICTVAQAGGKAIETPNDNAILGRYFRRRLGLSSGAFVETEDLERFGSNFVRLYRDGDDSYRLSFQPPH
jgi:hypothetical protein